MCSKTLCFLVVGFILILGMPAVLSESYNYSANYKDEKYSYTDKEDYDYYEYDNYEKYDYDNSYYSYYGYYKYKNYDYVLQSFLYRMLEHFPVLEKLFCRFF